MQKIIMFKKLKIKIIKRVKKQKKKEKKKKENCNSLMQRQKFIVTIKNVAEYAYIIYTHKQNQSSPTKIKYNS